MHCEPFLNIRSDPRRFRTRSVSSSNETMGFNYLWLPFMEFLNLELCNRSCVNRLVARILI